MIVGLDTVFVHSFGDVNFDCCCCVGGLLGNARGGEAQRVYHHEVVVEEVVAVLLLQGPQPHWDLVSLLHTADDTTAAFPGEEHHMDSSPGRNRSTCAGHPAPLVVVGVGDTCLLSYKLRHRRPLSPWQLLQPPRGAEGPFEVAQAFSQHLIFVVGCGCGVSSLVPLFEFLP